MLTAVCWCSMTMNCLTRFSALTAFGASRSHSNQENGWLCSTAASVPARLNSIPSQSDARCFCSIHITESAFESRSLCWRQVFQLWCTQKRHADSRKVSANALPVIRFAVVKCALKPHAPFTMEIFDAPPGFAALVALT